MFLYVGNVRNIIIYSILVPSGLLFVRTQLGLLGLKFFCKVLVLRIFRLTQSKRSSHLHWTYVIHSAWEILCLRTTEFIVVHYFVISCFGLNFWLFSLGSTTYPYFWKLQFFKYKTYFAILRETDSFVFILQELKPIILQLLVM